MDVQDLRHEPPPLRVQAGLGPEAPLVVRRDDFTVVSREDAAVGAAGYRDVVRTFLGRLRRPRFASRTIQTRKLREQVAAAEARAATEERARIAHELHDLVAHSVSEMVVQASGVRYSLGEDQRSQREALRSIEQIGREALTEMRRMLGVMPEAGGEQAPELTPQPGLAHLDRLIAEMRNAGLPVTLHVEGERPALPVGIDLSAYRIVQEGLANALKHANCAHADVTVRYAGDGIEVEIADDGSAVNGSDRSEGERLAAMRERVALYGGTLETGPRSGGGFRVRAQLPVEAQS